MLTGGQYDGAHDHFKVGVGVWFKPAADHPFAFFADGAGEVFEPVGGEDDTRVGGGDDGALGGGDGVIASGADVSAWGYDDVQGQPFFILAQDFQRVVCRAAVTDDDFVGHDGLLDEGV